MSRSSIIFWTTLILIWRWSAVRFRQHPLCSHVYEHFFFSPPLSCVMMVVGYHDTVKNTLYIYDIVHTYIQTLFYSNLSPFLLGNHGHRVRPEKEKINGGGLARTCRGGGSDAARGLVGMLQHSKPRDDGSCACGGGKRW